MYRHAYIRLKLNKEYISVSLLLEHLVLIIFRYNPLQSHGIHQHFGVYYAMGIGLAFEGIMGSFYHICPNNSNFQFG